MKIIFLSMLLYAYAQISLATSVHQPLTLAVYAYQPPIKVKQEYQPLADFMAVKLPHLDIQLKVLNDPDLATAVKTKQVDMLIVNPNLYEKFRHENLIEGVSATVLRQYHGVETSRLGGVMFTLAKNTQFTHLQDLQAAKIAIPNFANTGAYRVPLYEFHQAKIDYKNLNLIEFGCNDAVVEAVLSEAADVGFVRTAVLEDWFLHGEITPQDIRIINQKKAEKFPFLLSTELIPEWPVVLMPSVSSALSREILSVLYQFNHQANPYSEGHLTSFAPPLDYEPFEKMLKALKLSPYDVSPKPTLSSIWDNYWHLLLLGLTLLLIMTVAFILTERYRRKIWEVHSRLTQVIDATRVGTWEWNLITGAIVINQHFAHQIGYEQNDLHPFNYQKWLNLIAPDDLVQVEQKIQNHFAHPHQPYQADYRFKHKKGHWVWIHAKGLVVDTTPDGQPLLMDGTHTDISLQKNHELLLNKEANFDHLTGLMNRNHFMHLLQDALNQALQKSMATEIPNTPIAMALVFIDLDDFKPVNDLYGHEAGDIVLKSFAHILKDSLRPSDLACRLGGDEFILLIQNYPERLQLENIIARILTQVQTPMIYANQTLKVSCSIGVYDNFSAQTLLNLSAEEVVKKADKAMYQAKAAGKNQVVFCAS